MISINSPKSISILLPNTNKALHTVLQEATEQELATLSKGKDLASIMDSILRRSTQNPQQESTLLNLVKTNPTLKDLGTLSSTLENLLQLLSQEKKPLSAEKNLRLFLSDIQNIDAKNLQTKVENSGLFLESKIQNILSSTQDMQGKLEKVFSEDFKALLLKTESELTTSNSPNRQDILKHIDKLTLQIDYHQLVSHLSNASSLYIPYSWDALKDGNFSIKKQNNGTFFTDIHLELHKFGSLDLRLGMFNNRELSIHISAHSQELQEMIRESLPTLKKQLYKVGVIPKEIRFIEEKKSLYSDESVEISMGFEVKV